jgi:hypothetical protein
MNTAPRAESLAAALENWTRGFARDTTAVRAELGIQTIREITRLAKAGRYAEAVAIAQFGCPAAHAHGRDCSAVVYRLTWPGRANRSTVTVALGECGAVYLTAVTDSTATAQFSPSMPQAVVLAAVDAVVAAVDLANDATARR